MSCPAGDGKPGRQTLAVQAGRGVRRARDCVLRHRGPPQVLQVGAQGVPAIRGKVEQEVGSGQAARFGVSRNVIVFSHDRKEWGGWCSEDIAS